jgi:predicted 3-demethylubiquinone-9 3-methyltransferase (glyoxalase superfamily)
MATRRKAPKPKAAKTAKAARAAARARKPARAAAPTKATKASPRRAAPMTVGGPESAGNHAAAVRSITPFLWFDQEFEEAARFYVSLFPGSRVEAVTPRGGSFVLAGQRFMGLNGGPRHGFTPAVSFFVVCRDQEEVDRLWEALEDGGRPGRCGWIDDRFGVTWQIVPEAFLRLTSDPDPRKVRAVFDAMMGMGKMDVAGLEAAYASA